MELSVVDGKVVFVKWKIACSIPEPPAELTGETLYEKFVNRLGRYRIERGMSAILADSDAEKTDIEAGLKELGIAFTTDDISPTAEQIAKAKEIEGEITTRTEAIDYIEKGGYT
jgi:hypothetical protein